MKSKSSIGVKDLVQLIGIILMGLSTFLGLNYAFGINLSVPIAIVLIVAVYAIVYVLIKLKKSENNQAQKKTIELFLFILGYGTIAIVSGLFILHFLTIETNKKNEIKNMALNSLDEFDNISIVYDKYVNSVNNSMVAKIGKAYKEKRAGLTSTDWNELGLTGGTSQTEENTAVETHETSLIIMLKGDNYQELQEGITLYKNETKKNIAKWDYFSIVENLEKIDGKKMQYIDELSKLSKTQTYDKDLIFAPEIKITVDSKVAELKNWARFDENTKWLLSVLVILVVNAMILFPYFFSERSGRRGPSGKDGRKDAGFTW